jgi:thymidine kinase
MADRIIKLICRKCGQKGTVTLAEDNGWPVSTSDTFYLAVPPDIIGEPNIMCTNCKTRRPYMS